MIPDVYRRYADAVEAQFSGQYEMVAMAARRVASDMDHLSQLIVQTRDPRLLDLFDNIIDTNLDLARLGVQIDEELNDR